MSHSSKKAQLSRPQFKFIGSRIPKPNDFSGFNSAEMAVPGGLLIRPKYLFSILVLGLFSGLGIWGPLAEAADRPNGALRPAEIMTCARSLVESDQRSLLALEAAGNFLDAFAVDPVSALAACKRTLESVQQQTDVPSLSAKISKRDLAAFASSNSRISAKSRLILLGFLAPRAQCKKLGVNAAGAFGIGIGLKLDAAFCVGSNGRRWIELSPGAGVAVGGGVAASVNGGKFTRESQIYDGWGVDTSASGWGVFTGGIGLEVGYQGDQSPIETRPGDFGLAIGQAVLAVVGGQVNLALIPLGTHRTTLDGIYRSQFANPNQALLK